MGAAADRERLDRLEAQNQKLARALRRALRRIDDLERQLGWVETSAADAKRVADEALGVADDLEEQVRKEHT
jgi:molecular chaperone GrpE (heat shock protein)